MTTGLIVNAGSSSVKMAVLRNGGEKVFTASVSEIGPGAVMSVGDSVVSVDASSHAEAIAILLGALGQAGVAPERLDFAAHRVVHGGAHLTEPKRLTDDVIALISDAVPLAPIHNPAALAGIFALAEALPDLPQTASFDTAFHATIPEVRRAYAIPREFSARGIRRYGFHGSSYAALVRRLPEITGRPLPGRLLACHLGNGASLCAIAGGRSVATTMGYSPVSGLIMGSRVGEIDANAVLRIAEDEGVEAARDILNHQSGLLALGGRSDMRQLSDAGEVAAIDAFVDAVVLQSGAMIAALGGLDAVAFTGGIGEKALSVREAILDRLSWTGLLAVRGSKGPRLHAEGSGVEAWIVPADEEAQIALDARRVLGL